MDRIGRHIDIFGLLTSGLCAIHCLALPFLLSFGIAEGMALESSHDLFEISVLSITFFLAIIAVISGIRKHSNLLPLILFLAGIMIICFGLTVDGLKGHILMALGGLIVACAHLTNHKMLRHKVRAESI